MSGSGQHRQKECTDLTVGTTLPPVSLPMSVQRLVMIAAANRDFAPIHHDKEAARDAGADHAFTNMMFIMAMLERCAVQWAGPRARVVAINSMRMTAFNQAGDVVTCRGEVLAVEPELRLRAWLETRAGQRTATAEVRVRR